MTSNSISDQTKENLNSSFQMPEPTIVEPHKIQTFEWIDFPEKYQEISYMSAFLKEKHAEDLDYLALDIEDFNLDQIKERNTSMNDIIKDQYLRILKYGNVSSFQSKQKKTPEKSQENENIYDLDDSFIDDSDIDQGMIKMEVYQAQYTDYLCNQGGVGDILRTEHYKNRLNDLESIRKFTMEDKKVYMKKPTKKQSKKNKKKNNFVKEKKTPKKSRQIVEISSEEDEKKPKLFRFENLRPEEKKMEKDEEVLENKGAEEGKIVSETTSTVETNSKGKKSVNTKEKPSVKKEKLSVKKDESKRKRDSMVKKNEIFNANHPTLGKFKTSANK